MDSSSCSALYIMIANKFLSALATRLHTISFVEAIKLHRGLAASSTQEDVLATGLALEQRCKNLYSANWRGQLTMIDQRGEWKGDTPPVTSALVTYAAPRGALPASIILHEETDKDIVENLSRNNRASLTIGRTDPPVLVNTLRAAGMQLPCLSMLGNARRQPDPELGHALRRAQKIYSRLPGFPTNWLEGLDEGTAVGFALDLQSVRYVDMTGKQHTVDPVDFDGAFIDPLAPGQTRLLSTINSDPEQLTSLQLFCAAYMQTAVRRGFMTQADRRGFTILAEPLDSQDQAAWREFRIAFNREIPEMNAVDRFMAMLESMREEAQTILQAANT